MRYKVPQNIDMQDRIIGPLTMIQFVYAIIGTGLAYSIVVSVPKPVNYILAAPVALFTIALAFIKINERPFLDFFLAIVNFMSSPKQRIWHHNPGDTMNVVIYKPHKANKVIPTKDISHGKIERLAHRLDTPS